MDVLLEVYKKKSVHISAVYVFQFDRMRHSEWMAIKLASKCRQNVVKMPLASKIRSIASFNGRRIRVFDLIESDLKQLDCADQR